MKPIIPGSRRKKIILFYVLAVVLPGIILGYMAYRGIHNDQALLEKESRKRLEAESQTFFAAIDSSLVQFMIEQTDDSMLSSSKQDNLFLLAMFAKDSSGHIKIIKHKLLYSPDQILTSRAEQLSQIDHEEGLHLEFREQMFPEALRFYQNKILKSNEPTEKIYALVASARLYLKMNQPEKAKSLYEQIRKDYLKYLLNGQMPVGLMASLEILKINRSLGEKDEARANYIQIMKLLLHPPCEYSENQFELFYQYFNEIVTKTDPEIDSLLVELNTQKARTDYLIRLINEPDLMAINGKNHINFGKYGISCIPINSDELSAVYLSWDKSDGVRTYIVVDFPAFLKFSFERLIQKLDPNSLINTKIEDNNGKLIFSKFVREALIYLSFPFPENLPQYKLLLSENPPGFLATLLKAGSGIYLVIFILIALLMVLGFVFTIHTLNEELRLNKLKSEFISNVSHELKNPLTSIRMMTEMLHHNRVHSEERKSAYYSVMLEESERLSHLIDNILDFSRIDDDRRKFDFADVDMDELLLKFLESTRDRLSEPDFVIRYNCPDRVPLIQADADAMIQVFYNLVDNAIKFSGKSRQIEISLTARDGELLLCVKDYGIGIFGKDQEKIFDRFYRVEEPRQMGIRGSGIGLTIVKKIIETHRGFLTLESRIGQGSTFCVHLPTSKNMES